MNKITEFNFIVSGFCKTLKIIIIIKGEWGGGSIVFVLMVKTWRTSYKPSNEDRHRCQL